MDHPFHCPTVNILHIPEINVSLPGAIAGVMPGTVRTVNNRVEH